MRILSFEFLPRKNSWIHCSQHPAGPAAPEIGIHAVFSALSFASQNSWIYRSRRPAGPAAPEIGNRAVFSALSFCLAKTHGSITAGVL
ncbi:MAG: hypothetical protein LBI91_06855, partial [Spirochaetaceae bacterium]|nr:hypothetical protein [Spirochaetaceae bacterium]